MINQTICYVRDWFRSVYSPPTLGGGGEYDLFFLPSSTDLLEWQRARDTSVTNDNKDIWLFWRNRILFTMGTVKQTTHWLCRFQLYGILFWSTSAFWSWFLCDITQSAYLLNRFLKQMRYNLLQYVGIELDYAVSF